MIRYVYSLKQKVIEIVGRHCHGIKVLMFHQVDDDKSKWEDENVSITFESFKTLITSILGNHEFVDGNKFDGINRKNKIWITFDDIYEDTYQTAMKYLMDLEIPFTVFVSEKLINTKQYINDSSLRSLIHAELCCIAFHSKHHLVMRQLKKNEKVFEMDSVDFDKTYSVKSNLFAFPYGSIYAVDSYSVKKALQKFDYVFNTIQKECSAKDVRKRLLPRINVCESNVAKIIKKIEE